MSESDRRLAPRPPIRAWQWLVAGALVAALAALLGGCAHWTENQPEETYDPKSGYRWRTTPPGPDNSDEIFVILAFSGGGTRAAAFSFGALEELRRLTVVWQGRERRLLDEVDLISSVSGGSFTAAYYGLFRERTFTDFRDGFLYRNITAALARGVLNPLNWPKLASPTYDRIDLAADLYDREIFGGKNYGDLRAVGTRPFIVVNATDMSFVSRFEFTQEQFDLIGSDLSSYPVARGVAASSAFPLLLSPLSLRNQPPGKGFRPPGWIADALVDRQAAPREYATAQISQSYLDRSRRPFLHLLDGGLADNTGLRGPAYALTSVQGLWSLQFLLNTKIKYLVVISVNAKPAGDNDWDRRERAPGVLSVLSTVTTGPLGNYSDEMIQYVRDRLDQYRQDVLTSQAAARAAGRPVPQLREVKFYPLELTFQDVADSTERAYLNQLATSFDLPREGVDRLRAAAAQLLRDSPAIQQLRVDLRAAAAPQP